jgi:hypothetical protein
VQVRAGLEKFGDMSPGLSEEFREAVYEKKKKLMYKHQRFDLARLTYNRSTIE